MQKITIEYIFAPKFLKQTQMPMQKGKFFNVIAAGNGRASIMLYGEIGGDDGVSPERIVAEMSYLSQSPRAWPHRTHSQSSASLTYEDTSLN